MNKNFISNAHLGSFIYFIILGTTTVIGTGGEAKQDAWLVMLLALGFALIFFMIFSLILKRFPGKRYTEILEIAFGKFIGKIVVLIYALYFLFMSSRALTHTSQFLNISILDDTPFTYIHLFIILFSCYAIFLGVEVFGRTSKFFMYLTIIMFAFLTLIVIANHFIEEPIYFLHLTPVLENGFKPVFDEFQVAITNPFGELIVILMFYSYVKNTNKAIKSSYRYAFISSALLILFIVQSILIIGPDLYANSIYRVVSMALEIKISFLERLDSIAVSVAAVLSIVKHIILFFGAVIAMQDLFGLRSYKLFIVPTAVVIVILSNIMGGNTIEFLDMGFNVLPYYLHYPIQFGIPLILFLVILFRKKKFKNELNNS